MTAPPGWWLRVLARVMAATARRSWGAAYAESDVTTAAQWNELAQALDLGAKQARLQVQNLRERER